MSDTQVKGFPAQCCFFWGVFWACKAKLTLLAAGPGSHTFNSPLTIALFSSGYWILLWPTWSWANSCKMQKLPIFSSDSTDVWMTFSFAEYHEIMVGKYVHPCKDLLLLVGKQTWREMSLCLGLKRNIGRTPESCDFDHITFQWANLCQGKEEEEVSGGKAASFDCIKKRSRFWKKKKKLNSFLQWETCSESFPSVL